jgi:hypothetical protein
MVMLDFPKCKYCLPSQAIITDSILGPKPSNLTSSVDSFQPDVDPVFEIFDLNWLFLDIRVMIAAWIKTSPLAENGP